MRKKVFVPLELYAKLSNDAKDKNITVDEDAERLLNLGIQTVELLHSAKRFMKGGESEL